MTPTPDNAAEVARRLSKAQRVLCIDSEPGAFGRDDEACGADIIGAGRWASARALERLGLGDIEETLCSYPLALYFNNSIGLSVREILLKEGGDEG